CPLILICTTGWVMALLHQPILNGLKTLNRNHPSKQNPMFGFPMQRLWSRNLPAPREDMTIFCSLARIWMWSTINLPNVARPFQAMTFLGLLRLTRGLKFIEPPARMHQNFWQTTEIGW